MPPRPRGARKLLVASIGVATMTYVPVSCGASVANLVAIPTDSGTDSGTSDALDARPDSSRGRDVIDDFPVANLVTRPDSGDF